MLYIYTSDNCPKCEKQKKTCEKKIMLFLKKEMLLRIRQIQDEID